MHGHDMHGQEKNPLFCHPSFLAFLFSFVFCVILWVVLLLGTQRERVKESIFRNLTIFVKNLYRETPLFGLNTADTNWTTLCLQNPRPFFLARNFGRLFGFLKFFMFSPLFFPKNRGCVYSKWVKSFLWYPTFFGATAKPFDTCCVLRNPPNTFFGNFRNILSKKGRFCCSSRVRKGRERVYFEGGLDGMTAALKGCNDDPLVSSFETEKNIFIFLEILGPIVAMVKKALDWYWKTMMMTCRQDFGYFSSQRNLKKFTEIIDLTQNLVTFPNPFTLMKPHIFRGKNHNPNKFQKNPRKKHANYRRKNTFPNTLVFIPHVNRMTKNLVMTCRYCFGYFTR